MLAAAASAGTGVFGTFIAGMVPVMRLLMDLARCDCDKLGGGARCNLVVSGVCIIVGMFMLIMLFVGVVDCRGVCVAVSLTRRLEGVVMDGVVVDDDDERGSNPIKE